MTRQHLPAIAAFAAFAATIPAANWTLDQFGFVNVPWLGPVASGVIWIGLSFVLRDIGQMLSNRWATIPAVGVGVALSWLLASPALAVASAAAFAVAETLDWLVYTPLAERNWPAAVLFSGAVGAVADSALFLSLAFGSTSGWWQLAAAKTVIVLAASPVAMAARRAVSVRLTVA